MENDRDENVPLPLGETSKPTSVLSFLPGFKSKLSPNARMNPTSPSVNHTPQCRVLDVSTPSPNRSILRDLNSFMSSFKADTSPKSTDDMNGVASGPSTEKESVTVVRSLANDIASTGPDKCEVKHRISGLSEVSENSFETAVGGDPVGHLPDLVQSETSFQSGFGSDTDTSAVYESAGENDDSVSLKETYRDYCYTALYDTPVGDKTQVLDSSADSGSTVTASCFACVDTDGPSDLKGDLFVSKRNPALSHLHRNPDLNLSDLANNLRELSLVTPLKLKIPPTPKSETNSVLEVSGNAESEWLDSDVEVIAHCERSLSDPLIVYEGKSTLGHTDTLSHGTSGRPSIIEVSPEEDKIKIVDVSVESEIVQNSNIDRDEDIRNCVELTEDSLPGRAPSVQEETQEHVAPEDKEVDASVPSPLSAAADPDLEPRRVCKPDVINLGDDAKVPVEQCEVEPVQQDSVNAEVTDIVSALGEVSLKEQTLCDSEGVEKAAADSVRNVETVSRAERVLSPVADQGSFTPVEADAAIETSLFAEDKFTSVDVENTSFASEVVDPESSGASPAENPDSPATKLPDPFPSPKSVNRVDSFGLADETLEVLSKSKDEDNSLKGVFQAPEETADEQVSIEDPAKETEDVLPVVARGEISKEDIPQDIPVEGRRLKEIRRADRAEAVSEEVGVVDASEEVQEVSQAVVTEAAVKEQVLFEEPVEQIAEFLPAKSFEVPKEFIPEAVEENIKEVSPVLQTENISIEEIVPGEPTVKIVGECSQTVPTEETTPELVSPEKPVEDIAAQIPEESPKEDVPHVETLEETAKEVYQAVRTEAAAAVVESKEETVKEVPPADEEITADVSLVSVTGEVFQDIPKEGIAREKVPETVPTDTALEEVAEVLLSTTLEVSKESISQVVSGEEKIKEVFPAENLSIEEIVAGEPTVKIVGKRLLTAPTEETAQEQVLPEEPVKEIAEKDLTAVTPAESPKEVTHTVPLEGNGEEVCQAVRTGERLKEEIAKEDVYTVPIEKAVEEEVYKALAAEKVVEETVSVTVRTEKVVGKGTSPVEVAEVLPSESVREEVCSVEHATRIAEVVSPAKSTVDTVKSDLDSTTVLTHVLNETKVQDQTYFAAHRLSQDSAVSVCANSRVEAIRSLRSSGAESSPAFLQRVTSTSTPLEDTVKENLNITVNLDDTIDCAQSNVSATSSTYEGNNAVLDVAKSPEEALDLRLSSETPLDLSCAQTGASNTTRTSDFTETSPLLTAKAPLVFDQTFDIGGFGEPNFNSTFAKLEQTFIQQVPDETFVLPKNATFVRNPSPPKPGGVFNTGNEERFSPRQGAPKSDSLKSLIAVCDQQERNLREEDDLIHGEKEPSPDFNVLSTEAAKVAEEILLSFQDGDQEEANNATIIMASNFDKNVNPFATKSKVAVSPPQGRRPAPHTFNGSQSNITMSTTKIESKVNALDLNVSEAGPDTAGDHFQTEEIFRDPATFDFLSQLGSSSSRRDLAKESLYVKFDPLVGFTSNTTSDIPLPASVNMQPNQSETNPAKEQQPEEPEPTKNVESAVEASGETDPLPPPRTPVRTKTSALATEKLISLSPAVGPSTPVPKKVEPTATVSGTPVQGATTKDSSGRAQVVTQDELIRRLQEHQIVLEEQDKAYQDRIAELQRENDQLNKKVQEKAQGLNQLSLIMKEYEKTISRLVAEKEQEKKAHEEEKENLVKERDSVQGHLNNIEIAFADLHRKYERSKAMIEGFKKNEEVLNAAAAENKANLDKMQSMYDMLKSHAVQKLDTANQELVAIQQRHQQETAKLNAIVRKLEIKSKSLEESLEQKTKENEALAQICDELINSNN